MSSYTYNTCKAPFINLFFGNRGKVMACCANKMHVLGEYPAQSIMEIWGGERVAELRDALKNSNYQKGCIACKSFIDHGNVSGAPFTAYTFDGDLGDIAWPRKMEFEISNTCNLECVMCTGEYSSSIRERRERKPPLFDPYDEVFVEQIKPFLPHLTAARFVGGEPFLIQRYYQIWEMMGAVNPSIQIYIQTNGTVLNTRVKGILEAINASISISIDSLTADKYSQIRKNGNLQQTLENIHYFSDYCHRKNTSISISFCSMSVNWREIPRVAEFASSLGATIFYNTVHYPVNLSLQNLSEDELLQVYNYLEEQDLAANTPIEKKNKQTFLDQKREVKAFFSSARNSIPPTNEMTTKDYLASIMIFIEKQNPSSIEQKHSVYTAFEKNFNGIMALATEQKIEKEALLGFYSMPTSVVVNHLPYVENISVAFNEFRERILPTLNRKLN